MKLNSISIAVISLVVGILLTELSGIFHTPQRHFVSAVFCEHSISRNVPTTVDKKGLPFRYYKTSYYICADPISKVLFPWLIADTAVYGGVIFGVLQILRKKKRW
jgi:hypothetical protein